MPKRTTLTLEDDVAAGIEEMSRRTGRSMKDLVNDAIRTGLGSIERTAPKFKVRARDMGLRPGIDLDDIQGLLDRLIGHEP